MTTPNKLNIYSQWVYFLFTGILIPFFEHTCSYEFDKMQIPYKNEYVLYPPLYIVCLATAGICVFVR